MYCERCNAGISPVEYRDGSCGNCGALVPYLAGFLSGIAVVNPSLDRIMELHRDRRFVSVTQTPYYEDERYDWVVYDS